MIGSVVSGTTVSKTVVAGIVTDTVVGTAVVSEGDVISTGTAAQPASSSAINMKISFFRTASPFPFFSIHLCAAN